MMGDRGFGGLLKALDPQGARLWRDEFGDLHLEVQGEDGVPRRYDRVHPARAFPLTGPEELISFFDEEHEFLGMMLDIREMDECARRLVEEDLGKRYFAPRIRAVTSLRVNAGIISWQVDTDRGRRAFQVRDREDIRPLPPHRLLIRDVDGNRYEIPDYTLLDFKSRELLEQFL